jgi:hypothetical protein
MADAQSLFSQLFDDTSIQSEQPAEPARQVRTRPALPQTATARPSNGAVTKTPPPTQELAKPAGRAAPAPTARPAQPSASAQKATVLTSKRPRDEPLIRAKNFVQLEADESSGADDDESEEPSLSDDDEDALEAAEREAYDDQEYDDDEDEDDEDDEDEPPAPRSRHTPSPKRGAATAKPPSVPPAKPSKVTGQAEQQLLHKQAQLALKEAELTKREAELAKKEALAVARDRDQTQKETELNELHLLVQRHHRAMMEQQAINHAVSDSIDKRLCVLEEQERKPKEVVAPLPPLVTAPLPVVFPPPPARTQIMLEREQVERMLPRQLVDELTYIALTQGRIFDLTAYRAPSDVVDRDLVSIEVTERASGRFVHCQTRWPV